MPPVAFVHYHLLKAILVKNGDNDGILEYSKSSNFVVGAAGIGALASLVAQAISGSKIETFDPKLLEVMKNVITHQNISDQSEFFHNKTF